MTDRTLAACPWRASLSAWLRLLLPLVETEVDSSLLMVKTRFILPLVVARPAAQRPGTLSSLTVAGGLGLRHPFAWRGGLGLLGTAIAS